MHNFYLSVLTLSLVLVQCINPNTVQAQTLYPVKIASQPNKISLYKVVVEHRNEQHVLRGKVKR